MDRPQLAGQVALVTGAGHKDGLGRAIALRLAKDGANLVVTDVAQTFGYRALDDFEQLKPAEQWGIHDLAREIVEMGREAYPIVADLRESQQVINMATAAWERFSAIDILVNNAAIKINDVGIVPIVDYDEDVWRRQLAVNLTAPFLLSKHIARRMIDRKLGGKIINIASVRGKQAKIGASGYVATKHGLIGLTKVAALELAPHGINVNAVCPGATMAVGPGRAAKVRQELRNGRQLDEALERAFGDTLAEIPLRRLGRQEEVANLVAFLASSEADWITGQAINIDGGYLMA